MYIILILSNFDIKPFLEMSLILVKNMDKIIIKTEKIILNSFFKFFRKLEPIKIFLLLSKKMKNKMMHSYNGNMLRPFNYENTNTMSFIKELNSLKQKIGNDIFNYIIKNYTVLEYPIFLISQSLCNYDFVKNVDLTPLISYYKINLKRMDLIFAFNNQLYDMSLINSGASNDFYSTINKIIPIKGCSHTLEKYLIGNDDYFCWLGKGKKVNYIIKDPIIIDITKRKNITDEYNVNDKNVIFLELGDKLFYSTRIMNGQILYTEKFEINNMYLQINKDHFHKAKNLSDPLFKKECMKHVEGPYRYEINLIISSIIAEKFSNQYNFCLGRMWYFNQTLPLNLGKDEYVSRILRKYSGKKTKEFVCATTSNRLAAKEYYVKNVQKSKFKNKKRCTLKKYNEFCAKVDKNYTRYFKRIPYVEKVAIPDINVIRSQNIKVAEVFYEKKVIVQSPQYVKKRTEIDNTIMIDYEKNYMDLGKKRTMKRSYLEELLKNPNELNKFHDWANKAFTFVYKKYQQIGLTSLSKEMSFIPHLNDFKGALKYLNKEYAKKKKIRKMTYEHELAVITEYLGKYYDFNDGYVEETVRELVDTERVSKCYAAQMETKLTLSKDLYFKCLSKAVNIDMDRLRPYKRRLLYNRFNFIDTMLNKGTKETVHGRKVLKIAKATNDPRVFKMSNKQIYDIFKRKDKVDPIEKKKYYNIDLRLLTHTEKVRGCDILYHDIEGLV